MLKVKFLRAKNSQVCKGKDLVLQTGDAYLIGCVTCYSNAHTWEKVHRNLNDNNGVPDWKIGKAEGYRCFVVLHDSLGELTESQLKNPEIQSYIQDIMKQMAEFYLTQLSDGNLRGLSEK